MEFECMTAGKDLVQFSDPNVRTVLVALTVTNCLSFDNINI